MTRFAYVGTYTSTEKDQPHRKEGIYVFHVNPADGKLTLSSTAESGRNPSFLAIHPSRKYLYSVNELMEGEVSSFVIEDVHGTLTRMNSQPTHGAHPCYISVAPTGKWVMTSNYSSGSVAVYPVLEDGQLGAPSDFVEHSGKLGPNAQRQERAHAHSIDFDPSGQFVLAADLGLDKVIVYRLDEATGKLMAHGTGIPTEPGAGPRHFTFHPNGRFLYVANELNCTVAAYEWDARTGTADPVQTVNTLPAGFDQFNLVADIHFDGSGRYLLVSNRGHNSLAIYEVEPDGGGMVALGHVLSGGNWPRNFGFEPSGANLYAANEISGDLAAFRFDRESGAVTAGAVYKVPAPVCVKFLDL